MRKQIEIFQNTLLKLIVRSGLDADRQNVVLDAGEIGYTTDTKRLYVGDGTTYGGVLAGNIVIGEYADFSTVTSPSIASGDLVFITGNESLYRYIGGDITQPSSYDVVGRIYSPWDTTISFSPSGNKIRVNSLSANNFSTDAVGKNVIIDGSGRISLSAGIAVTDVIATSGMYTSLLSASDIKTDTLRSTILSSVSARVDNINSLNNSFVTIQRDIKIGSVTYTFPATAFSGGVTTLLNDGNGNLTWGNPLSGSLPAIKQTALPITHFIEFTQTGAIARNTAGVQSVVQLPYDELVDYTLSGPPGVPYKIANAKSGTLLSNELKNSNQADSSGAWIITLTNPIENLSTVVVKVDIKNAAFYWRAGNDPGAAAGFDISTELQSRYFWVDDNTLIVYTYVPRRINNYVSANVPSYWYDVPLLTPGYKDSATRFSVTIYADQ